MTGDTHAHAMPFGAEIQPGGAVRFRLWAPARKRVAVVLEDSGETLPMARDHAGWFELVTRRAAAGARYRFQLDDGARVPDPASRRQAEDVHGPSVVRDPRAYHWRCADWRGRPWTEAVLYELHVGAFSPEGDFDGVRNRLDYLAGLGVTALELMPLADFPGARNWGYDGVLPFAPDRAYGDPDDLKRLIDEAHERNLMVFLDVVYNHFGPEGNYLSLYAPEFFTTRHQTPWGAAIDFTQPAVRSFFIHNALYWLEEFTFDGLRFDAVHAIRDDSERHVLDEIAAAVADRFTGRRAVHLVLENDDNQARFLGGAGQYSAQWNDDIHHAYHVLLTGERDGYYNDYRSRPVRQLARGLSEGFIYQGQPSRFRRARRGEPSVGLPPHAFVDFLQNHDQIGNRALGERLAPLAPEPALAAATVALLLSPHIPLLFMGQEWNSRRPFLFFCDFSGELAEAVREGRKREFATFSHFTEALPDATLVETFEACRLDWPSETDAAAQGWLSLIRRLLAVRAAVVAPLLPGLRGGSGRVTMLAETAARVHWEHEDGARLTMAANFSDGAIATTLLPAPATAFFRWPTDDAPARDALPPWSVVWFLSGGAT